MSRVDHPASVFEDRAEMTLFRSVADEDRMTELLEKVTIELAVGRRYIENEPFYSHRGPPSIQR
jgi:hypothetical protein